MDIFSREAVSVDHPEALVFRGGVAVFIEADGAPHLFDHEGVNRLIGGDLAKAG